jgi:hypothetical protein
MVAFPGLPSLSSMGGHMTIGDRPGDGPRLGRGRGRSPVPVPDLSGIGDSPPSPSPIRRGRGRSPVPDSHRGVRALLKLVFKVLFGLSPLSEGWRWPGPGVTCGGATAGFCDWEPGVHTGLGAGYIWQCPEPGGAWFGRGPWP